MGCIYSQYIYQKLQYRDNYLEETLSEKMIFKGSVHHKYEWTIKMFPNTLQQRVDKKCSPKFIIILKELQLFVFLCLFAALHSLTWCSLLSHLQLFTLTYCSFIYHNWGTTSKIVRSCKWESKKHQVRDSDLVLFTLLYCSFIYHIFNWKLKSNK